MNAFVRDGAVNRKRRARQSLSARNTEPEGKKIHKTDDDGAMRTPRYLASSSLQIYSGESSVNQSKVVATEKDSRYLNVEFMRAKAFSYLNFKKISSSTVNKLLKEHLKKYDENESHLKRTFEQCYDVTASVEKSKAMMKQLATISCVRLDLKTNLSSEVNERRLSISPRKGVKKTVKKPKKINDTKGMNIHLKEKIDNKNLILFGKYHSSKDKKILYTEKINNYNKTPKLNYDSDSTVISDAESTFMGLTKSYSLHNTKIYTCEVTRVTGPTNCAIVRIDSNLRKDNLQSSTFCAKKSISKATRLKNSVHNKFKKGPNVCDTGNSKIAASNINNLGEMINSQLNTDASIQNAESFALETANYVMQVMVPQFEINGSVKNSKVSALETNADGENTVPHKNSEGPVLAQNIDDEEMTFPPLIMDEFIENSNSNIVLETDVGEFMVPKLIIDETVQYSNSNALETNGFVGEIIDLEVEKSTSTQDLVNSQINTSNIDTDVNDSKKQSGMETDDEEFMVPKLIIDETVQYSNSNALETNGFVGEIIDLEVEKSTSTQDLVNSQINTSNIDTDVDDSKKQSGILDHTNLVLKIRKIINPDDKVFENSMIKDLATYFLNDDFLSKVDALWKTIESELVGELIINLLMMFNDKEYNMAQLTGCLICIFREIVQKSSILPCQLKLKLIVFLDAIKKYIKFHDNALWRTWFVPSMFFDWCFIVAFIFMGTKNEFKIDFNKSVIRNATAYYKMVKQRKYQFIRQDLKPSNLHKKSGIFELTRIDDLLEIDDLHATIETEVVPNILINIPSNEYERKTDDNCTETNNNSIPENIEDMVPTPELTRVDDLLEIDEVHTTIETEVLPNISINKPLNEHKHKKLKTDDNCIETINNYIPENIEGMVPTPAEPKISKLIVRPQFNYSNSFIKKLGWFNGNVSELVKKFKVSTSKESIESSTVQNNTTVIGNNKGPSSVNKRRSAMNIPTKSKKLKTQIESPRVFFTIADNPREFDITYGSSAIAQKSRSSALSKNASSSSTVPKYSSSSAAVPQCLGSSTISQTLPPYYNHYSSSYTSSQLPVTSQTVVPRNLSVYYNNFTSNITQAPIGLQTMPSLSNTSQSSDARSANSSVNVNVASIIHPLHLSNQQAIHHQSSATTNSQLSKAANTWPSNQYNNMCSDPSCSKSSTCHTQYTNSAPSYSHSPYYYNIPSAPSHSQYSNALTYPSTYTNPLVGNLLASNTAKVASMNTYTQQTNYDYRSSYLSHNKSKTLDHNTQVSPDLPDVRLPNMPNNQAADIINKTCMAANCTNFSSFSCNTCVTAFYCSIQCQKSDWHYHQNECCVSF